MSKLLLVMVLISGVASIAGGEVLYPKVVDVGMSGGRDGSVSNPLYTSDIVGIEVWLTQTGPGNQYGGYWIDGLDISLEVDGPGSLDIDSAGVQSHPSGDRLEPVAYQYNVTAVEENPQKVAIDGYNKYFNGWTPWEDMVDDGDLKFLTGFLFHMDGVGYAEVSIKLDGPSVPGIWNYAGNGSVNYTSPESNWWKYPGPSRYWTSNPNVREIVPEDLGSIVINQIPEPLTLGLLGVGGVALWRRGKAVG